MRLIVLVAVIAISIACGKSDAEKQAEATEKAAEEMVKAAQGIAAAAAKQGTAAGTEGASDVAKAMAAAFTGKGADGKPVDPVAFKTLQTQLPTMADWEMREPRGERMTMPMPYSQISARYRKDEANIDVQIMDTGMAPMLIAPWTMMMTSGYSKETNDGYEKATAINGNPAVEKWNTRDNRGELNILLGKRFMVTVKGHRLSGISDVHAFASAMNFDAIAALK
jgi:hypothetical protein